MKKILFLLAMLPMMWACSSGSDNEPETPNVPKEEKIDIVGVWENGDYFVSFSGDGYYTAYIENTFIDSGNYTLDQSSKMVKSKNLYFDKETQISVSISNGKLTCGFKYTNVLGESLTKSMTFNKTSETPQGKSNTLIGKTYEALYSPHGKCRWDFSSNYAATFSTIEVKPKVRNVYYIYRSPYLYTQIFKPKNAGLNNFYSGCDKGVVYDYKVATGNGAIESITNK